MTDDPSAYDIAKIRKLLTEAFTAEDLRRFCEDRQVLRPIVPRLGPGMGLDDMVDEVITYCRTHLRFPKLLAAVKEVNPLQYARFEPYRPDIPSLDPAEPKSTETVAREPMPGEEASPPDVGEQLPLPMGVLKVLRDPVWQGVAAIIAILALAVTLGTLLWPNIRSAFFSTPAATLSVGSSTTAMPTAEPPSITTALATESAVSAPGPYDGFDNPSYDGNWNPALWDRFSDSDGEVLVSQQDGILTLKYHSLDRGGLRAESPSRWTFEELGSVEATVMLDDNIEASIGTITIGINNSSGWWLSCSLVGGKEMTVPYAWCNTVDTEGGETSAVLYDSWHTLRFETNPDTAGIDYFLDGRPFGDYIAPDPDTFRQGEFSVTLHVWSQDRGLVQGYADEVWIGNGH